MKKILGKKFLLRYVICTGFSALCDNIIRITLIWKVAVDTEAPAKLALLMILTYLPQLFALGTAKIIDRVNRKYILIFSDFVSGLTILLFAMYGKQQITVILTARFLLSLMDAVYSPASAAYMVTIAGKENLLKTNLAVKMVRQTATIAGILLSGLVLVRSNSNILIFVAALLYFAAAVVLTTLPNNFNEEKQGLGKNSQEEFQKVKETGSAYLKSSKFFFPFLLIVTISNIAYMAMGTALPIYAQSFLNSNAMEYSIFEGIMAFGTIVGAYFVGKLKIKKIGYSYFTGMIFSAIFMLGILFQQNIFMAGIFIFLLSAGDSLTLPSFTRFHLDVPEHIRGRIFTFFDTCVLFANIPAAVLVTWLCNAYGVEGLYFSVVIIFVGVAVVSRAIPSFWKANI